MMTRHLPLTFPHGLPLDKVIVGPCRNKHVSALSVGDLLHSAGIDPDGRVEPSRIPYQVT
jgi:hypothetical protein